MGGPDAREDVLAGGDMLGTDAVGCGVSQSGRTAAL